MDWWGLVVVVGLFTSFSVAAWWFGVDSRDPSDRDPFIPEGTPRMRSGARDRL
jgi:hypothetical protein